MPASPVSDQKSLVISMRLPRFFGGDHDTVYRLMSERLLSPSASCFCLVLCSSPLRGPRLQTLLPQYPLLCLPSAGFLRRAKSGMPVKPLHQGRAGLFIRASVHSDPYKPCTHAVLLILIMHLFCVDPVLHDGLIVHQAGEVQVGLDDLLLIGRRKACKNQAILGDLNALNFLKGGSSQEPPFTCCTKKFN